MSIRAIVSVLFFIALPVAASAVPAQNTASSVLARVRAVVLSRPLSSIASVRTTSSIVAVGLPGHAVEWDDVRNEGFAETTTGTPAISGTSGWTGTTAWSQDETGIVRVDGGQSTRLQSVDQAYMAAYAYLRPDLGGASATLVGVRHEANRAYDVVDITPRGGTPLDFWIDAHSNLPAKVETTIGINSETMAFADYRRTDGIDVPFRVTEQDSNGNGATTTVTSVVVNAPLSPLTTRVPRSTAHDFSISSGTSTTVPIQIINGHIYVQVMLDGKGPYTFIFDTGGSFIVTPDVAAALHEHSSGTVNVAGVGAHTESAQFTHVDTIEIGNATIRSQDFIVLPIGQGFGVAEGMKIDGMFGPAIPDRFLTAIDYANGTLTLSMPGTSAPLGSAVPFFFDGTIPKLPVFIDGVAANADLDTGNRGQLFLTTPFLAAHPALAANATTADGVDGFGIGGPSYGRLGRVRTVGVGPFTLDNVVGVFATQTTGATADPFTAANLGGGVWSHFTLTLDYPHERIYLAPNADYASPFTYDRSGLFLIDNKGAVTILDARTGTPAAGAGLKKGDVILAVDGKPASTYTLAQIRTLFMSAPGTVVHLHISSGETERDVDLTLAQYV